MCQYVNYQTATQRIVNSENKTERREERRETKGTE